MSEAIIAKSGVSKDYVDSAVATVDAKIPKATTADMDIYVSTTGNDTTGDGTQGNPYATLEHAISVLPTVINHTVNIYIVAGTYNISTAITVEHFSGTGTLNIGGRQFFTYPSLILSERFTIRNNFLPIEIRYANFTFESGAAQLNILDTYGRVDISTSTFQKTSSLSGRILNTRNSVIWLDYTTITSENSTYPVLVSGNAKMYLANSNTISSTNYDFSLTVSTGGLVTSESSSNVFTANTDTGGQVIYATDAENRAALDVYSKSEVDAKIPNATTADMNIYVSPSGNDDTGDGTQEKPYQSVYHVLEILPKIINHYVKIYVASGTYTLSNYIKNFTGNGSLTITKVSGDSNPLFSSVRAFLIQNNEIPIYLEYIDCVTGYSCFIDNPNGFVEIFGSSFAINDAQYADVTAALEVYGGAVDMAQTTVSNTNSGKYAMNVYGSRAKVFLRGNNTITANHTSSLKVWNGALVVLGNSANTFTLEKTSGGQIIYNNVSENRTALDVYSKSEVDSAIATAINNIVDGDEVSY